MKILNLLSEVGAAGADKYIFHTEFMKYPECQEVIIESKEAIERYSQEMAGK